jgi:retinol dehydrogenase 12
MIGANMKAKVCLVTGASTGVGRETARNLAALGATVAIVSKDPGRGEEALQDIRSSTGNSDVHLLLADLGSMKDTRRLAAEVKARFPRLDLLINNAGLIPTARVVSPEGLNSR